MGSYPILSLGMELDKLKIPINISIVPTAKLCTHRLFYIIFGLGTTRV